jgi:thiamine biosynthesis lipoprotein
LHVEPDDVRAAPGCRGITVDHEHRTITLPPGVGLDLGGIGKGDAADRIAAGLMRRGARGACVGLGGDVCCRGVGPVDGAWRIDVEDPFDEDCVLVAPWLRDAAIVTSTRRFRRWQHQGTWRHHIIDPATGRPSASGLTAVVVTDRHTWRAEALAKAALVAGLTRGQELLTAHEVAAWLIDDSGAVTPVTRSVRQGSAA